MRPPVLQAATVTSPELLNPLRFNIPSEEALTQSLFRLNTTLLGMCTNPLSVHAHCTQTHLHTNMHANRPNDPSPPDTHTHTHTQKSPCLDPIYCAIPAYSSSMRLSFHVAPLNHPGHRTFHSEYAESAVTRLPPKPTHPPKKRDRVHYHNDNQVHHLPRFCYQICCKFK